MLPTVRGEEQCKLAELVMFVEFVEVLISNGNNLVMM